MIIRTPAEARALFESTFKGAEVEHLAVAYLGQRSELLAVEQFETGSLDAVELPIRSIMLDALRLEATGIVIAHNHPSGDPSPSEADLRASRALADTARNLGVRLTDHLIFGGGEVRSLQELGLL